MAGEMIRNGTSPEDAARFMQTLGVGGTAAPTPKATGKELFLEGTIAEHWKKWETLDRVKHAKSWSTRTSQCRKLVEFLGPLRVRELDIEKILEYRNERLGQKTYRNTPIKPGTVNLELRNLSSMFGYYVTIGKLHRDDNPMRDWRKWGMLDDLNDRFFCISEDEFLVFLAHCNPLMRLIAVIAFETGMRRGEISNLEWAQVSIESREITLSATTTKGKRERVVYISDVALAALEMIPRHIPSPYVFPKSRGGEGPMMGSTIYKWFKAARKTSKITGPLGESKQPLWFHSFRHAFGSLTSARGLPMGPLMDQLGHRDMATTNKYRHRVEGYKAGAVDILNKNPRAAEFLAMLKEPRKDAKQTARTPLALVGRGNSK